MLNLANFMVLSRALNSGGLQRGTQDTTLVCNLYHADIENSVSARDWEHTSLAGALAAYPFPQGRITQFPIPRGPGTTVYWDRRLEMVAIAADARPTINMISNWSFFLLSFLLLFQKYSLSHSSFSSEFR